VRELREELARSLRSDEDGEEELKAEIVRSLRVLWS
jgi:hypothetical protein